MKNIVKSLVIPLFLLILWQISSMQGWVSPYLLPAPTKVFFTAIEMWQNSQLQLHIITSLTRVFIGFGISVVVASLLALCLSRYLILEQILTPLLALMRMIPPLAMTPLLILWLGIGSTTQISIIILASFFPVYLNARDGLKRLDEDLRELAQSLDLSNWRYFMYFTIPAAVPSWLTGVRLAFGYAWRALIGAEMIAAASGLGYLILDSQELMRTDKVLVGILAIGIIGYCLDQIYFYLIKKLCTKRFTEVTRA